MDRRTLHPRRIFAALLATALALASACQADPPSTTTEARRPASTSAPAASPKSPPTPALRRELASCAPEDLRERLTESARRSMTDTDQARRAAALVQELARQAHCFKDAPPLSQAADLFKRPTDEASFEIMRSAALPALRELIEKTLSDWQSAPQTRTASEDGLLAALEILAVYGEPDDLPRLQRAARLGPGPDNARWGSILMGGMSRHPEQARLLIEGLSDPMPKGLIGASLLGLANRLSARGELASHPFDSAEGLAKLRAWILGEMGDNISWRVTAVAGLVHLRRTSIESVLEEAEADPNQRLALEAAWVRAKLGQKKGFERLSAWTADARLSVVASAYLKELGRLDLISANTREEDFAAQAEFANWLLRPGEFGRPPDNLALVDKRVIDWPPSADKRQLRIFRYRYPGLDGAGVAGGERIFSMKSEDGPLLLRHEEIYALACCEQLKEAKDARAEACDLARGLELLGFSRPTASKRRRPQLDSEN